MKCKLLSTILTTIILSTLGSFNNVLASQMSTTDKNFSFRKKTKVPYQDEKSKIFFKGSLSGKLQINDKSILDYLEKNKSMFLNVNYKSNFKILSINKDELGLTRVKAIQTLNNIPIRGSEIILHLDKNGVVKNIIGSVNKYYKKPLSLENTHDISPNYAISIAEKQFNYKTLLEKPKAEKQVIIKNATAILVYSVNIHYTDPHIANWEVLVDAKNGSVIKILDKIRYNDDIISKGTAFN
ncbi:Zn-dependent metalloprotease [Clostridium acetobutylicum]|uniref:Extracellular neutral metalloprotease, NPRE (Fragment or C-term. domain) n=1 Tax=Clostridium acetobutylicum (strain ATCC 824 / DSM 792 / JCM 1419 / IAM 19013 / LMG 5710 / NBRC 13948 / NRRL B-527 / VKM B-1787 / 2291 / W) TaxID=272562 RepID=Q97G51_CLOAB|nr:MULTISPECIES: PepSY domain-containing protein [Clostridium]AAK80472.1 Extracellular neutral metalloprotease, NPRE (fragment or C-term. domain) [Clostridium acetobutylicum ATCC 824]ADZ21569.1 Extracellular neutral metalloprotease [Clostridium acetobutylicum EA 2018]AEI34300.1 extracellular neutral metalloprotease, NPRE [Clostridium acetobutylicum DSM 1731]AWV79112.1 peptidase [Clostridium acetobutylicum]MBC2394926.1 peptidase [Clostridium acetobutylicum]